MKAIGNNLYILRWVRPFQFACGKCQARRAHGAGKILHAVTKGKNGARSVPRNGRRKSEHNGDRRFAGRPERQLECR